MKFRKQELMDDRNQGQKLLEHLIFFFILHFGTPEIYLEKIKFPPSL